MARIAIAGFLHETNTFARQSTPLESFITADAWPGLTEGDAIFSAVSGANIATAGFIEAARAGGHQIVPLLWASANPSGIVTGDAYEDICARIINRLRDAMPVDAVFLDLHGAMVSENYADGEGELLKRLRAIVGSDIPIVAALDFHANISEQMVEFSDILTAYRTYPHIDMRDTGIRAMLLLDALLKGQRWHKTHRKPPFLIPMIWQCTLSEPMTSLMRLADEIEREYSVHMVFAPGFPLADVEECGPSVVAYGPSVSASERAALRLFQAIQTQRPQFNGKLYSVAEAVDHALNVAQGLTILSDTQDNPGGGATGDTTDILHELIRRDAPSACVAVLCDPVAAKLAQQAGPGANIYLTLGGGNGIGAPPVQREFVVEAVGDGRFTGTGPFYLGCKMDLGIMARLRVNGVQVLVSSRKQQAADRAMFHHLGLEPATQRILALKSSVHFRADFGALAREILMVSASGENTADIGTLVYRHLRHGVEHRTKS